MNLSNIDELARHHHSYVASDGSGFRRAARTLQSVWRENKGYPVGEHNGRTLGSRLPTDFATKSLANYLTPKIREVVRTELSSSSEQGRLFAMPRIYNDLLSSQPLCFNLFGELVADLDTATALLRVLRPAVVEKVTAIRFEHSPGRGDLRFTGDRSAFDVFIEYRHQSGGHGFFGVEVKYHEDLAGKPTAHRPRYDDVAHLMGCFRPDTWPRLRESPLQQIWRDHLLAGATKSELGYVDGVFVFLYPTFNTHCKAAVERYQETLTDMATFDVWTLEAVVTALRKISSEPWIEAFHDRYLDFRALERAAQ